MFSKNKFTNQHVAGCPTDLPDPPSGEQMMDDLLNIRANDPLLKLFPCEIFTLDDSTTPSSLTPKSAKVKDSTLQQLLEYSNLRKQTECAQLSLSEERNEMECLKSSLKNRLDDINALLKTLEAAKNSLTNR